MIYNLNIFCNNKETNREISFTVHTSHIPDKTLVANAPIKEDKIGISILMS